MPREVRVIRAWPAGAVAAAERPLLDAGVDLMAVASTALARRCAGELRRTRGRVPGARAVLLVGTGNNGGDALHAGALLRRRGVHVTALLAGERAHPGGLVALRAAGGTALGPVGGPALGIDRAGALVSAADLVVDGVLGIGAHGAVRGPLAEVLGDEGPGHPRRGVTVACDLPSGLDPDTGAVHGPVLAADVTVTFGAAKPGLLLPPGDAVVGELEVVDLGLDLTGAGPPAATRWSAADAASAWPRPRRSADKYARGVLGVVAGTDRFPGAAVLASSAAVATGAGMVRYAGPAGVAAAVLAACPEAVPDPLPDTDRVQAWLVGPGMSPDDDTQAADLLAAILDRLGRTPQVPAVVDAGAVAPVGLAAASEQLRAPERLLLTPHAGELARLLTALGRPTSRDDVLDDPAGHARRAARESGAVVLLKGSTTLVAGPDGRVEATASAPAWLATAGTGDVLSGVAGTLLAAGTPPRTAGATAAYVHGVAGRLAARGGPVRAGSLVSALSPAVAEITLPARARDPYYG